MKERGKFVFYIGYLTIELYYPYYYVKTANFGFSANTILNVFTYDEKEAWMVHRSIAMKLVGFGFGLAWKHCHNPKTELDKKNK